MNVDDAIELVTKMHVGPRDILVVTLPDESVDRLPQLAMSLRVGLEQYDRFQGTPVLFARAGTDVHTLPEPAARQLYDALKRRFEGGT